MELGAGFIPHIDHWIQAALERGRVALREAALFRPGPALRMQL